MVVMPALTAGLSKNHRRSKKLWLWQGPLPIEDRGAEPSERLTPGSAGILLAASL
jgi:hypothetical protein